MLFHGILLVTNLFSGSYSLSNQQDNFELYSRCVVSGCGKIAMHVVEKLIACGAHPVTVSGNPFTLSLRVATPFQRFNKVRS